VLVHPANVTDTQGGCELLATLTAGNFPRLRHIWADGGYFRSFAEFAHTHLGLTVEVVKRPRQRSATMDKLASAFLSPTEYDLRGAHPR